MGCIVEAVIVRELYGRSRAATQRIARRCFEVPAVSIFVAGLVSAGTYLLLAHAPPSQGTANRIAEPTGMDQQILSKMHQVNQMEIDIGKLAEQKSQDPEVQRYGRRLVRDHEMGD